jgi:hypothetical protein
MSDLFPLGIGILAGYSLGWFVGWRNGRKDLLEGCMKEWLEEQKQHPPEKHEP